MTTGIIFSNNGIENGKFEYDSRKQKVIMNLKQVPKHVDVIEMDGGTVPHSTSTSGSLSLVLSEVLFRIEHNMPFKPRVEGFFDVTEQGKIHGGVLDNSPGPGVGAYYRNWLPLITNAFGYGEEQIVMEIDSVYITVKHTAYTWGSTEFFGIGNNCKFNFRYLITNLPDISEPVS
jgi:hypothetical protein